MARQAASQLRAKLVGEGFFAHGLDCSALRAPDLTAAYQDSGQGREKGEC